MPARAWNGAPTAAIPLPHSPSALMATPPEPGSDTQTTSWPELAIGLYEKLTGRGAEIAYEFDDFELMVPSGVGGNVEHAAWKMNGTVRIRTRDDQNGGAAAR